MSDTGDTVAHYSSGNLRERLHTVLRAAGHDPVCLKPTDLGEADHFHLGGRASTGWIADELGIGLGLRVLDVGCGLGGPARYFAGLGASVTGVDVTKEFIDLAGELNQACALSGSLTLRNRPGQDTGLPDASFEVAVLSHVGMNVADKPGLFSEIFRLLRPGGIFGVYDLIGSNDLSYPMPWSPTRDTSYVESEQSYRTALAGAGFQIQRSLDHRERALAFAATAAQRRDIPLAGPLVLGENPAVSMKNVIEAVAARRLSATLLVARKPE